jgi:hypothetical protein
MASDNPYGLSQSELKQIDAMAAAAAKPNPSFTALSLSGIPGTQNVGTQLQAQETRVRGGQLNSLTNAVNARAARRETGALASSLAGTKASALVGAASAKAKATLSASELANTRRIAAEAEKEKHRNARAKDRADRLLSGQAKLDARAAERRRGRRFAYEQKFTPRALPPSIQTDLGDQVDQVMAYERGIKEWKPEYASGLTMVGKGLNWIANNASMISDNFPEMRAQAEWWRDYGYDLVLEARHSKFGSAFTANEERMWNQVSVSEGMPAADLLKALKKRGKIAKDSFERQARATAESSFNAEAVKDIAGPDYKWSSSEPLFTMPPYLEPEDEESLAAGMSDDEEEELLRLEEKYGTQ